MERQDSTKPLNSAMPAPTATASTSPLAAPASSSLSPALAPEPAGPGSATQPDDGTRERMIREAAYRRYRERGNSDGNAIGDWLEAEAEVDRELARSRTEAGGE